MKREEKRMERVDGKAAGDYGFITCQRIDVANGARADAIPNVAGGEGSHGPAKAVALTPCTTWIQVRGGRWS